MVEFRKRSRSEKLREKRAILEREHLSTRRPRSLRFGRRESSNRRAKSFYYYKTGTVAPRNDKQAKSGSFLSCLSVATLCVVYCVVYFYLYSLSRILVDVVGFLPLLTNEYIRTCRCGAPFAFDVGFSTVLYLVLPIWRRFFLLSSVFLEEGRCRFNAVYATILVHLLARYT